MAQRSDWSLEWRTLLFAAIFTPLLLGLGFWQLQRAEEKADLLAQFEQRRAMAPVPLHRNAGIAAYTPVQIVGRYDSERYWLLDNRIQQGRYGVEVMAVFELLSGEHVLVNRGWLPADPARRTTPEVPFPEGEHSAVAEVLPTATRGVAAEEAGQKWPQRVQWLQLADAEAALGSTLLPLQLKLQAGQRGAFTVGAPAVVNVPPEKHRAYAVQWFALAATLVILVIWRAAMGAGKEQQDD